MKEIKEFWIYERINGDMIEHRHEGYELFIKNS